MMSGTPRAHRYIRPVHPRTHHSRRPTRYYDKPSNRASHRSNQKPQDNEEDRTKTSDPGPSGQPDPTPPTESSEHATLVSIVGDVSVRRGSDGEWQDAVSGQSLQEGDEIHTGPDSEVKVTLSDGSFVLVRPLTETAVGALSGPVDRPLIRMLLKMGEIAAKVHHVVDQAADFAIRTPNATASVRGTEFLVNHEKEGRGTSCTTVYQGVVLITPENTSLSPLRLSAGRKVCVSMEAVGPIENAKTTSLSPRPASARGWLGVSIQQVSEEIADALGMKQARGALVAGVDNEGPAKPGGIQIGDVIVMFDGHDIKDVGDLPRLVAETPIGNDVQVVVIRKGKAETMTVKVGRGN